MNWLFDVRYKMCDMHTFSVERWHPTSILLLSELLCNIDWCTGGTTQICLDWHWPVVVWQKTLQMLSASIWPGVSGCGLYHHSWWRHQMETFSALLAICAGNSPATGEFPAQRPVTRSFDVFFDLRLKIGWVNNGEAGELRRHIVHYDVTVMFCGVWEKSLGKRSVGT